MTLPRRSTSTSTTRSPGFESTYPRRGTLALFASPFFHPSLPHSLPSPLSPPLCNYHRCEHQPHRRALLVTDTTFPLPSFPLPLFFPFHPPSPTEPSQPRRHYLELPTTTTPHIPQPPRPLLLFSSSPPSFIPFPTRTTTTPPISAVPPTTPPPSLCVQIITAPTRFRRTPIPFPVS
nr:leucine-rich repeat extensin-like protein 3 [Arachis hypogaea]